MRLRVSVVALMLAGALSGPAWAQSTTTPATATDAGSADWGGQNIRLGVSAGLQAGAPGFTQNSVLQIYAEDAPITVDYGHKSALLVDGGIGFHLKGRFGVGVAVSYARSKVDGHVTGEIPHPFYFDQPRAIDGTASDLSQAVIGTHIQVLYLWPVNGKFDVMLSGGPSLILLQQDLVSNVNFSETYPYDTATFESAQLVRTRRTGIGANAGADLTWHVTPMLGVGVLVRYTRATVSLPIPGASNVHAHIGGAQAGVGLRVSF